MSNRRTSTTTKRPTKKARPGGLRDALARKTKRTATYRIPLVATDVAEAAGQRYSAAAERLEYAKLGAKASGPVEGTPEQMQSFVDTCQRERDEAKAELDDCFYPVVLVGLPEQDFDALVNVHPPTDEQKGELWNADTFPYALLEACALDSDVKADEWREELASDRWTQADKNTLVGMVYQVNRREFSDGIPKD